MGFIFSSCLAIVNAAAQVRHGEISRVGEEAVVFWGREFESLFNVCVSARKELVEYVVTPFARARPDDTRSGKRVQREKQSVCVCVCVHLRVMCLAYFIHNSKK